MPNIPEEKERIASVDMPVGIIWIALLVLSVAILISLYTLIRFVIVHI